jgi:predicted GNAT family N-acyltransferase
MLAGYALSMTRELKVNIPVLIPLFERLDNLFYNGRAVKDLSYYVMGQICVDKAFRGQGVFRQLYASHKALLSGQYNYCITEVSTRNLRSMQAHYAIGFELLHRFSDTQDEWNIVLWDWTK